MLTDPVKKVDIAKKFGASVRKWREKLCISQEELAKRAGFQRTYVCDIERGVRNISLKNIQRLADALTISLLTFFADFSENPPSTPLADHDQVDTLIAEDKHR